jgi:hypothetical protein
MAPTFGFPLTCSYFDAYAGPHATNVQGDGTGITFFRCAVFVLSSAHEGHQPAAGASSLLPPAALWRLLLLQRPQPGDRYSGCAAGRPAAAAPEPGATAVDLGT